MMFALLLYAYTRGMRFFPPLARMDEQIDELEAAVLAGPTDEQLQRLFGLKRELVAMRRSSPRSATCSPVGSIRSPTCRD